MAFVPILMAASAAISAFGAIKQGQQASAAEESQANVALYNAKVADMRAEQAGIETSNREDIQRRAARYSMGAQLAASGEAGAGLNEDLVRQSVYDSEADTAAIRYEGALKRAGYTDEAALQTSNAAQRRDNAKQAMASGYINAASALMSGASNYYGGKKLN